MRLINNKTLMLLNAVLFMTLIYNSVYAQDSAAVNKQRDLKDVIADLFNKKKTKEKPPKQGDISYSFLPGVSYSTTSGFLIGFSLGMSKINGDPKTTSVSSAVLSGNYTSKKQFNAKFKSDIYTKNNDWYIEGDWRLSLTSQPTFGIGTATPSSNEQNLKFDLLRLYEKVSKRIAGNFYLGGGIYFDRFSHIKTENDEEAEVYPNYHNEYNKKYNYDTTAYNHISFGLLAEFDSRDNIVNTYKGVYLKLRYTFNQKLLVGDAIWQGAGFEGRAFTSFGKINKHVFAGWVYGEFIVNGNPSYLNLPAIGWDKYEKSGRGYTLGRYRGRQLMYGEFEYRFPISSNGLFGGVAFVNVTTATNPEIDEYLFKYLKPAYGGGLRIKFDKLSRTNISIDYGKASDGSSSIVFNLGEMF